MAPQAAAGLAIATMQVATATNNPTVIAAVASASVAVAEAVVQTNPAPAAQIASAAVQAVNNPTVIGDALTKFTTCVHRSTDP